MSAGPANGDSAVSVTVTLDRKTNAVQIAGPNNPALVLAVLQRGVASLFQYVANENAEPERKVKTLDEFGVRPIRRIR